MFCTEYHNILGSPTLRFLMAKLVTQMLTLQHLHVELSIRSYSFVWTGRLGGGENPFSMFFEISWNRKQCWEVFHINNSCFLFCLSWWRWRDARHIPGAPLLFAAEGWCRCQSVLQALLPSWFFLGRALRSCQPKAGTALSIPTRHLGLQAPAPPHREPAPLQLLGLPASPLPCAADRPARAVLPGAGGHSQGHGP